MAAPSFLQSKGQRRNADDEGIMETDDILLHYARVYASRFEWTGGPRHMPVDFMEKALFFTGGVGPIKQFRENQLAAADPYLRGIYNEPVSWLPVAPAGCIVPGDYLKQHQNDKDPMLWLETVPAMDLSPLCSMIASAFRTLNDNLVAIRQPVVLQGTYGAEINLKEADCLVSGKKTKVLTLDRNAVNAGVLDLGGTDHTQNTIATINALDCEILARMGIKSAGTEKASGVTTEETISINQQLAIINRRDLEVRRRWLENPLIRERFPDLQVRLAPELEVSDDGQDTDGTEA